MFSHVMVGANDLAASKFYHAVLSAIGLPAGPGRSKEPHLLSHEN
jgi:hypothetical protein